MINRLILSCLKVFLCRICDVTFGSMRTVLVVKEKTLLASLVGFFEVFIWFVIVRDAINFDGPVLPIAIAYALGYAAGTYIGGTLAKRIIGGHVTLHVVTSRRNYDLCTALRDAGYGITVMNVNGSEFSDEKNLILADIDKRQLADFEKLVQDMDPGAFFLVQETKSYLNGYRYKRPGK